MIAKGVRKYFVLDTNVLLHNAESLTSFDDNYVILPMTVIEELDSFKRHNDELGRSARHVIRQIDQLRSQGSLKDGVTMDNSGILQIVGLDVHPQLADDLRARQWCRSHHGGERGAGRQRLHESGIRGALLGRRDGLGGGRLGCGSGLCRSFFCSCHVGLSLLEVNFHQRKRGFPTGTAMLM
jgi:hypothetical protein